VVKQYERYEALPGLTLNGELTLGENIADIGGLKLAFAAYRDLREGENEAVVADGFTEDQQFFLANAQIWCSKIREAEAKRRVQVDPHSPPRFRVNGAMANLPEFGEAFACEVGSPMRPEDICSVW
jgi:putative endopeptidase